MPALLSTIPARAPVPRVAPGDAGLPWSRARRLALGVDGLRREREAAGCFTSQPQGDPSTGQPAILPTHVLARLLHPHEIYFT